MKHHFKTLVVSLSVAVVVVVVSNISVSMTYHAPRAETVTETEPRPAEPPPETPAEFIEPDYTGLKTVKVTAEIPHELSFFAEVSAYTSSIDETDSTPNINAMGTKPGPGSIACPTRYAFGTKVIIGTDEFSCDDRMNPRYAGGDYFDIWIETKAEAFHWGRRTVEVTVLE